MLSNKAVLIQTVALSLLNTALFGYVNYDTASIQVLIRILLLCTNMYLLPTYELGVSVLTPSAFQVLSEELSSVAIDIVECKKTLCKVRDSKSSRLLLCPKK